MFQYSVYISTQLWIYPESDEYIHYTYISLRKFIYWLIIYTYVSKAITSLQFFDQII